MKKIIASVLSLILCCGAFSFAAEGLRHYDAAVQEYPAFSEAVHEADSVCELIVRTDGTLPDFRTLHPSYTVQGPDDTYVLCFAQRGDMLRAAETVRAMRGVLYAEENGVVTAQGGSPETPYEDAPTYMSYAADKIGLGQFTVQLRQRDTLRSVTVAVVDSGFVIDLPVFAGRMLEGVSFVRAAYGGEDEYSPYTVDYFDHGTPVASIVADCTQTLPVQILPIKVLDDRGVGSFLDTANGIRYAAEHGADIVNLSLASKSCSQYIHDAIDYAIEQDCLPVAATGNFAGNLDKCEGCPAHLTQCVTVSGCDDSDGLYKKSGYGAAVDLCAPGVDVPCISANGQAAEADGTSFAAPLVSAVAAMLQIFIPEADCALLTSLLMMNTRDIGDPGFDVRTGWGMPDLHALDGSQIPQTEHTVIAMRIETLPTKTTYAYREAFDPSGFSARVLYANGTTETVDSGFTFSGTEHLPRGTHTVSAMRDGQHAEFDIEVRFLWWQWIIWIALLGCLWY